MNYLVLLRHGESEWNKANKFTGFTDVELSENGVEEAKKAGLLLKEKAIKFDTVFTSTLKRANITAELALKSSGTHEHLYDAENDSYTMTREKNLRERDYGDLTGLNKDETRAKFGDEQVHIWRRSYDVPPPNGESLKDVVARVQPYYEQHILPKIKEGENILIAAHGNSLRALLIILGDYTPETINSAEMPTGVPMIFECNEGQASKGYLMNDIAA